MLVGIGAVVAALAIFAPWRVVAIGLVALFVFGIVVVLLYLRKLLRAVYTITESADARAASLHTQVQDQLAELERDLPERVAVRSAVDLARLQRSLAEGQAAPKLPEAQR